ncbi:hypothetical protein LSAT2_019236 [Lamellibrachia satsuma]|nr:hypothetical protein LSAT2_019236 [Lamellibrachia satsuma]
MRAKSIRKTLFVQDPGLDLVSAAVGGNCGGSIGVDDDKQRPNPTLPDPCKGPKAGRSCRDETATQLGVARRRDSASVHT